MIVLKSPEEIEKMKKSGKLLSGVIKSVKENIRPGVSTAELNEIAEKAIMNLGAKPAFKGYRGFPSALCTSINEEVVHGIPSETRVLVSGDIIKIDCGLIYQGYYSDMAISVPVGNVSAEAEKLMKVTKEALKKGIRKAKAGNTLGEVGHAIQTHVEKNGFSVVRDLVGHGIGIKLHEEPQIPNYGSKKSGIILENGMTLAIEPMVNYGEYKITFDSDGWTTRTKDGKLSAHFEHTIAITENGTKILTD